MLKFAENLKFYRKSINVTQAKFAQILNDKLVEMNLDIDYNNKSISMWEKGERFPDSPLVWVALANIMNVSLDNMMLSDISNNMITEDDKPKNLQAELFDSYLKNHFDGCYYNFDLSHIYRNIDEHIEGDLYHGMFYVLSSVKTNNIFHHKYFVENVKTTNDYINTLSKKVFYEERYFVRDVIDNGGLDVVATSDQIAKVWEGFFECAGNIEDYNTISIYDMDNNHIMTMVEYNIHINKTNFMRALNLQGLNFENEINEIILANKKFHLGIRWAKELMLNNYKN